jgi:hypothetical protein
VTIRRTPDPPFVARAWRPTPECASDEPRTEPHLPPGQALVLALQRTAGNAAVSRLLQRDKTPTEAAPEQAGHRPAPAAAAADRARLAAEAEAVETNTRIAQAIVTMAADKDNITARNTAELFSGPSPRVHYKPMTRRSDSESIRDARKQAAGTVVYFFTGTVEPPGGPTPATVPPGTLERQPDAAGTTDGNTIVIRGKHANGWRSEDEFKRTLIHEASHVLVVPYGEHPKSLDDDTSFDRYRDEFRSYFVEQFGDYSGIKNLDERAEAIKKVLIGTSLADTRGYPPLRNAYWKRPPNDPFRISIDRHKRPDGFNLTNSIRLDRLFTALNAATADLSKIDDVIVAIARLTSSERQEADASQMIKTHAKACGSDGEQRILAALSAPTTEVQLNRNGSARIQQLYEAIARNDPDTIRAAYDALPANERVELQLNAAALSFVYHNVLDHTVQACVLAMIQSGSSTQYVAMKDFLDECFLTFIGAHGIVLTELPPQVRVAVKRLTLNSRQSLYVFSEAARKSYVETLPAPVRKPLLTILRGQADP